jgi:hypothetical protein
VRHTATPFMRSQQDSIIVGTSCAELITTQILKMNMCFLAASCQARFHASMCFDAGNGPSTFLLSVSAVRPKPAAGKRGLAFAAGNRSACSFRVRAEARTTSHMTFFFRWVQTVLSSSSPMKTQPSHLAVVRNVALLPARSLSPINLVSVTAQIRARHSKQSFRRGDGGPWYEVGRHENESGWRPEGPVKLLFRLAIFTVESMLFDHAEDSSALKNRRNIARRN